MDSGIDLVRVVYFSTSSIASGRQTEEVTRIVEAARPSNARNEITGVLLHTTNRFAQVLEGPPPAVTRLYGPIAADGRHEDVRLIALEEIEDRSFSTWAMADVGQHEDARSAFSESWFETPDEDGLVGSDQVIHVLADHLVPDLQG